MQIYLEEKIGNPDLFTGRKKEIDTKNNRVRLLLAFFLSIEHICQILERV